VERVEAVDVFPSKEDMSTLQYNYRQGSQSMY